MVGQPGGGRAGPYGGGREGDGGRAAWRALDIEIGPGHYHFAPQPPRIPMRFRRAAVMRGFETDVDGVGLGASTLTVHDKARAGETPVSDDGLPHFDVGADGSIRPRPA